MKIIYNYSPNFEKKKRKSSRHGGNNYVIPKKYKRDKENYTKKDKNKHKHNCVEIHLSSPTISDTQEATDIVMKAMRISHQERGVSSLNSFSQNIK